MCDCDIYYAYIAYVFGWRDHRNRRAAAVFIAIFMLQREKWILISLSTLWTYAAAWYWHMNDIRWQYKHERHVSWLVLIIVMRMSVWVFYCYWMRYVHTTCGFYYSNHLYISTCTRPRDIPQCLIISKRKHIKMNYSLKGKFKMTYEQILFKFQKWNKDIIINVIAWCARCFDASTEITTVMI